MHYEEQLDKLLNAVIEISSHGVPAELILHNLIKNAALTRCEIDRIIQDVKQIKSDIYEEDNE